MKRWIAVILSIICAVNLPACSAEKNDLAVETEGMLGEAEIEAIFGILHREKKEEQAVEEDTDTLVNQKQDLAVDVVSDNEVASEMVGASIEGVPMEYSHLFETGEFDENLVWTGYDDEYAELIEAMYTYCEENVMGSIMLATDEEVLFAGGFNAKEADGETRVNPFTTYEIGSLTQPFTAAAIIQQIQEGNLKASDTLEQFFPDYPHGSEVTVDNLLHMDSGIPDYVNDSMHFFAGRSGEEYNAFMNGEMSDEAILGYLNKSDLIFEPGKKSQDSTTNFYLLALILEQVTGLSYEEYMQAYIFDICGLKNTTCTETGNLTSVPNGNGAYMTMGRVCRGAFDMHSNVCDILMWNRELMNGGVLGEEYLEYMTEARNGYACGWFEAGEGSVGQWGGTDAYLCVNFAWQLEDENLYFVMMIPDRTKWAMPGKTLDILETYLE